MARIRSVKPEFFDDYEFISQLPRDIRLYYVALWVRCCDDRGVLPDVPPWIAKETFPYDPDITPAVIEEWNRRLIELGRLVPYEVNGKRYLCVWHFLDHQKIDRPSKNTVHPIPPEWKFDDARWRWIERPLPQRGVTTDSTIPQRGLAEDSTSEERALAIGSGSGPGNGPGPTDRACAREDEGVRATAQPQDGSTADESVSRSVLQSSGASDLPPPSDDMTWADVPRRYHQRMGMIGSGIYDKLKHWHEIGMSAGAIVAAIDVTAAAREEKRIRGHPDRYLDGVLRGFYNDGIRTVAQLQARAGPKSEEEIIAEIIAKAARAGEDDQEAIEVILRRASGGDTR